MGSVLNYKDASPSVSQALRSEVNKDMDIFKGDLKKFLTGALDGAEGTCPQDMIKYLYSSVPFEGNSGADLWNRVVKLGSDYYHIPMDEAKIIDQSRHYLRGLFGQQSPRVIDLGPGGYDSLDSKTIPTLKAVKADRYVAFDQSENFALRASDFVKKNLPDIKSSCVHSDFTKPYSFRGKTPSLMAMYGCTLEQFPLSDSEKSGAVPLKEMLKNLGNMVGQNAILIATIDSNQTETATNCYIGSYMSSFMGQLWGTIKALVESDPDRKNNYVSVDGSRTASPLSAAFYVPFYNQRGVVHSFLTKKDMEFVVDGEKFSLGKGTQASIGFSERWSIEDVARETKGTGWTVVNKLSLPQSSVSAVVFAGSNLPKDFLLRAVEDPACVSSSLATASPVQKYFVGNEGGTSSAAGRREESKRADFRALGPFGNYSPSCG